MTFDLRAALVTNWPIKLTSLALAAGLWAAVAAEEPTTLQVPVTLLVQPPEGRALTRPLPPVQALYAGSARELLKLFASPPFITLAIPDTVTGTAYLLDLSPAELKLHGGASVRAQDVQPRRVEVALDAVASRTVPVTSRVTIRADTGFAIVGGVALSPNSLTVRGPEAIIAQVPSVSTVPLEIAGVRGPVRRVVAIDTASLGVAQVSRREVEVAADVQAVSERVLMAVPVEVRGERAGGWVVDPPTVLVTVRGPAKRVALLSRDSVAVVLFPTATGRRETAKLSVVTPPGIEASATPDTVHVQRRGDG